MTFHTFFTIYFSFPALSNASAVSTAVSFSLRPSYSRHSHPQMIEPAWKLRSLVNCIDGIEHIKCLIETVILLCPPPPPPPTRHLNPDALWTTSATHLLDPIHVWELLRRVFWILGNIRPHLCIFPWFRVPISREFRAFSFWCGINRLLLGRIYFRRLAARRYGVYPYQFDADERYSS